MVLHRRRPRVAAAVLVLLGGSSLASIEAGDGDGSIPDPLHVHLAVTLQRGGDGASLVSPALSAEEPFTEVLPSWNVAGETPFTVSIRVSPTDAGEAWSPWLRIGDWGVAAREGEVPLDFEGGKVAIDVLSLKTPQRRAQLRFASATPEATLDPANVRARLVLSDLSKLEDRVAAASQEPWPASVQLRVPVRSQRREDEEIAHRICSPTSVAMVAAYHGVSVPTREMAQTILDPHHGIYGNWNRAVQGAYHHGVPGELVRVSSWETVRSYLAAGRPLIASIRAKKGELAGAPYGSTAGHLLVVTGLGPDGVVHVNDPAAQWPGSVPRRYARDEMERVWFRTGGVAYALDAADSQGRSTR